MDEHQGGNGKENQAERARNRTAESLKEDRENSHNIVRTFPMVNPDGNSVELQADNFGNWEQSSEWMSTSSDFAADPISKPLDPDQLIAARKAGVTLEEIHRHGYAGEYRPEGPLDLRLPLEDPSDLL